MENTKEKIAVYEVKDIGIAIQSVKTTPYIDKVYIFCKATDKWTTADVANLLSIDCKCELIQYDTQEEKLILFGGLLAMCENCIVGTESFKVPSYYEDKIRKIAIPKPVTKKASKGKTEGANKTTNTTVSEESIKNKPETINKKVVSKTSTKTTKKTGRPDFLGGIEDEPVEKQIDEPVLESEEEPPFEDEDNRKLYNMIKVTSKQIGYNWDTDMLMGNILRLATEAETDEDFLQAVKTTIRNSDILVEKCTPIATEIRKLVHTTTIS